MTRCVPALVLSLLAVPAALAQEGPPGPAPELKKLEPMVGNWTGTGSFNQPGGKPSKWYARGTYRWALDGHFLQEDFSIVFEGQPAPLVFRAYLGWDRENKRYVNAVAMNAGEVSLHEVKLLPDGTLLQIMLQQQMGQPYAERSLLKVEGDKMTHSIDLLMSQGASITIIDGTFTRGGESFDGQFGAATWMGAKPHEAIGKLARSAGAYDVVGEMLMAAGQPPIGVTGVDTFRAVFGGTVLHGHTEGEAAGMPGKYVGEVFWGHDAAKNCLCAVYVSNMGEVMSLEGRWSGDGKLISTSSALWMGQPAVQRMLMEFDGAGAATRATGHTIHGVAPPFESFTATYTKKK